ncbi:hypothetical protein [Maribacter luteus]|uniref:Uncharacterized protein n=1 Tax=Maribacter luteus TaxID=2594478 RepID=A0A6I2MRQ9_9FLAO|nr:hypothetical protein [Maribacter luteus]MRX64884.1 hypothetical protein [Maribacter luteus]
MEPKVNMVQYVLECKPLHYEGDAYHYQLKRSQFYVNGKKLTKQLDVLAEKCAEILYPLILEVTFSGLILRIVNFEEIQHRWEVLLPKLKNAYKGEVAETYMNNISANILEANTLMEKLKRDVLYSLLVPRLFALGEPSLTKSECNFVLPHYLYKKGILFKGTQEIGKYVDKNGHITVSYKGTANESDSLYKDKVLNGELTMQYLLDNETTSMIHFRGLCEFDNPSHNKIEYRITRLKELELTK